MLLKTLPFLNQLITHIGESMLFQFDRQMLFDIEINLPSTNFIHKVNFVFIREENEQLIPRIVMEIDNQTFLMLFCILRKNKFITPFKVMLVILHLVKQLIGSKKSQCFSLLAKSHPSYCRKPLKKDPIDKIKVIIPVVSNLSHGVLADDHQVLQILIVETTNHLLNVHPFLVTSVLTLAQLLLRAHLVKIEPVIQHKKRSSAADEETEVLL